MAQQKTEVVEEFGVIQVQDKYQVITNPFWSNWFFSIGGGAEATFGDNDKAGSFGKRISPTLNFAIGKWFTPGLGVLQTAFRLYESARRCDVQSECAVWRIQPAPCV